jgi:hypothetical protein
MLQNLFKTFLLFKLIARREKVLTKDLWYIIEPLFLKEESLGSLGRPICLIERMLGIIYVLLDLYLWSALA